MKGSSAGRIAFGLNALLKFHSKRIGHYLNLVDSSNDIELVLLFNKYVTQSKEFSRRLYTALPSYNNVDVKPSKKNTSFTIKKFLQNLNGQERNELLIECEGLEREGLKIYRVATALSFLPIELADDVRKQMLITEEALRTFIMLRENKIDQIQVA